MVQCQQKLTVDNVAQSLCWYSYIAPRVCFSLTLLASSALSILLGSLTALTSAISRLYLARSSCAFSINEEDSSSFVDLFASSINFLILSSMGSPTLAIRLHRPSQPDQGGDPVCALY